MDKALSLFMLLLFLASECYGQTPWQCISNVKSGSYSIVLPLDYTVIYINSPSFPGQYPDNLDCEWTISVQHSMQDYTVRLEIIDFDMEESNGSCRYDNLTIYNAADGYNKSNLMLEACSRQMPAVRLFCTSGKFAYVRLQTDSRWGYGYKGFNISLQAIETSLPSYPTFCPQMSTATSQTTSRTNLVSTATAQTTPRTPLPPIIAPKPPQPAVSRTLSAATNTLSISTITTAPHSSTEPWREVFTQGPTNKSGNRGGPNMAAIAGGVVGGLLSAALLLVLFFLLLRPRLRKRNSVAHKAYEDHHSDVTEDNGDVSSISASTADLFGADLLRPQTSCAPTSTNWRGFNAELEI